MTQEDKSNQDALFQEAFKQVPPREQPSEALTARMRAQAESDWHSAQRARASRRWLAMAASFAGLCLAALFTLNSESPTQSDQLAQATSSFITKGTGIELETPKGWVLLEAEAGLQSGDVIRTQKGGEAFLRTKAGGHLAIAAHSNLTLTSATQVALTHGQVYYDSYARPEAALTITTPYGAVTDIGTQFQLSVNESAATLAVREGEVQINHESGTTTLNSEERIQFDSDATGAKAHISSHDHDWEWVTQHQRADALNGKDLAFAAEWYARETGQALAYASSEARTRAEGISLHGEFSSLTPHQAIEVAMTGSGLSLARRSGTLSLALD